MRARAITALASLVLALMVPAVPASAAARGAVFGGATGAGLQEGETPGCDPALTKSVTLNPGGIRGTAQVTYSGRVTCNFYLADGSATAVLTDRTNPSTGDGVDISRAPSAFLAGQYTGASGTQKFLDGKTYDGGRRVELTLELILQTPNEVPWGSCGPLPIGLRYVTPCAGIGTDLLTVVIGTGGFDTGLGPYASLPVARTVLTRAQYGEAHHDYPAADLKMGVNTPVYAIKAGVVSFSSSDTGKCGVGVYVRADNVSYMYCHFTSRSVTAGSVVLAGEQLGYSGETGSAKGHPHLHVEIRTAPGSGTRYCPQTLLQRIYDSQIVPLPTTLPTTGCFYKPKTKISLNKTKFAVGEVAQYFVTGTEPFSPIYWSSTLNGVDTGEDTFYGQVTDANGSWSGFGGTWTDNLVGTWTKTIDVDGAMSTIGFTVSGGPVRAATLTMDKTAYRVGETPLYTVRNGPPNSPIYWSSTKDGTPTAEVDAFYGHYTDANGNWTDYGGTWTNEYAGAWTKSVKIGDDTSTFMFTVSPS